ncbi:MAG: hypothetical protein K2P95_05040 [Hyphomonadaceae bacterium]|nr:hypothetical protein [Hyphomonadaceae bacterium]
MTNSTLGASPKHTLTPEQQAQCREAFLAWHHREHGLKYNGFNRQHRDRWEGYQAAWSAAQAQHVAVAVDGDVMAVFVRKREKALDALHNAYVYLLKQQQSNLQAPTPPERPGHGGSDA